MFVGRLLMENSITRRPRPDVSASERMIDAPRCSGPLQKFPNGAARQRQAGIRLGRLRATLIRRPACTFIPAVAGTRLSENDAFILGTAHSTFILSAPVRGGQEQKRSPARLWGPRPQPDGFQQVLHACRLPGSPAKKLFQNPWHGHLGRAGMGETPMPRTRETRVPRCETASNTPLPYSPPDGPGLRRLQ